MSAWACFYNCYTTESCYTTGDVPSRGAPPRTALVFSTGGAPGGGSPDPGAGWETASGVLISGVGKISPHANECLTSHTPHE